MNSANKTIVKHIGPLWAKSGRNTKSFWVRKALESMIGLVSPTDFPSSLDLEGLAQQIEDNFLFALYNAMDRWQVKDVGDHLKSYVFPGKRAAHPKVTLEEFANSLDAIHDSLLGIHRRLDSLSTAGSKYGEAHFALDDMKKSLLSVMAKVDEYERKFRSGDFSGPF